MNQPIKKVKNYRFIKLIGKGATSEVFEAKKEGSGEQYAVKMIRLKGLSQEEREIVMKQVDIIKSIKHPNIIHLYETLETPNNFYLVLELCKKGDLEKYLMNYHGSRLPEETAQRIIYCIADAVSLIHSHGIAHRDIKLANILLKQNYEIKLADFGLARENQTVLMKTCCGSLITMAPEIMLKNPYDKKVDVWSLGVILFQMIYGRFPFPINDGLHKWIEYVTEHPLSIPSEPPMPIEFKELLIGCLQKNPELRIDIKKFMANKWVSEGSEGNVAEGKKKPSVDELLRNISQEVKINDLEESNELNEIELLIAHRVNKNLVIEFQKLINHHIAVRSQLLERANHDPAMRNLVLKLDYSYADFLSKMSVKVGKEHTTQTLKVSELIGLNMLQPLSQNMPESDSVGSVILCYLEKLVTGTHTPEQKIAHYQLAHDTLSLIQRFEIRIAIKLANHICEDIEVGNVIEHIRRGRIIEEFSQQVEFTIGNFITIAIECLDRDEKVKKTRDALRKNMKKRIEELEAELGQHL